MPSNLAFYKYGPTKTVPQRPGPIQCVRKCLTCFPELVTNDDPSLEEIKAVMSYDDLLIRHPSWITSYQNLQYHHGQIDLLKRTLSDLKPAKVIYVAAVSEETDINYLNKVLSAEALPVSEIVRDHDALLNAGKKSPAIPIDMISCPLSRSRKNSRLVDIRQLRDMMQPLVDRIDQVEGEAQADLTLIVPVAITKDHEESLLLGVGSLCIQILEPYLLNDYIRRLKTKFKTGHLVQHLYHDLSINAACLPSHIIAFLLLYLDRPVGVTRDDLIEQLDWLRKSSMDLRIHMAFTGQSEKVVSFALLILEKYIRLDNDGETIIPIDVEALTIYASLVVPNVAYFGAISRSILMLHNLDEKNPIRLNLGPDDTIKVMKDDLLELSQSVAESLDTKLPCRSPCMNVQDQVVNVFTNMLSCGRYFRITEPRIRQNAGRKWAGDYDSDEEYYMSRRDDPAFKPWVVMTQRPYRLDRLNLFMNAIEPFISCDEYSSDSEPERAPEV